MKLSDKDKKEIIDLYTNHNESMVTLAQKYNTYTNKIRRLLIKEGAEIRDKSEAQKLALNSGRHEHPTKGKKRPEEFRVTISEKMKDHWDGLDDTERERRSELAKEQWDNMDDEQREQMKVNSAKAIRNASKEGSKLEKFLFEGLVKKNYSIVQHKKDLVLNNKLEVDMFLPVLKTVIEIDGPAHFFPIWGQDSLDRHIRSDNEKIGLLTGNGYVLIRVKNLVKTLSEHHKRTLLSDVIDVLEKIKKNFPKNQADKLIELEVK